MGGLFVGDNMLCDKLKGSRHYLLFFCCDTQETESFTREWSDYLSNAKRVRNKAYIEMPAGAVDRLKVRFLPILLFPNENQSPTLTPCHRNETLET